MDQAILYVVLGLIFGLGVVLCILQERHAIDTERQLARLVHFSEIEMTTEATLQQTLDDIKALAGTVVATLTTQTTTIEMLKRQIANGTPVSQEQLDALNAEAATIRDALAAVSAPAPAPVTPADPPASDPAATPGDQVPVTPVDPAATEPAGDAPAGDTPPGDAPAGDASSGGQQ